jgi:hypothetical protein
MRANESATPYFYPISIDLECRLASRGMVKTGRGRTVRLSSASVQFVSGDYLPPESTVEIFIPWPAQLENAVALQLYVRGRTVRSQDPLITVEIQRYEFRTRRMRSLEVSDQAATSPGASAASA